jgi:peroxiredoxin
VRDDKGGGYDAYNYVKVGDEIPEFTVSNGTGTVSTEGLAGKRTLLVLFSTECGDCRRVLPVIEEAWRVLKEEEDVVVITISREETAEAVGGYWEQEGFTMPYFLDPDRAIFKKFASAYTPRVYLINRQRRVVEMHVETLEITSEELCRRVLAL